MYKIGAIIFIAGVSLQSCSKTEYEYQKRPYNDIKQFIISGSTGDAVKCLVSGDSITIYWNPDVELPSTITPTIVVDGKATISPASGASVPFNKNTTYTVTAENGEVKTYRLKPVLTLPIPAISRVSGPLTWLSATQLNIYGEYFLANTDTSEIAAYMQRVSDGFEFPLELVKERTTNYSLVAQLPAFSAEQDTGLHKLFVKAGNRVAEAVDVRFLTPFISHANPVSNLVQEGQAVHSGDSITIYYSFSDDYSGKIAGYYNAKNIDYVVLYFSPSFETIIIPGSRVVTDNTVSIKLPDIDKYIGQTIGQYRFIYKTVPPEQATVSAYYLRGFINTATPVEAK